MPETELKKRGTSVKKDLSKEASNSSSSSSSKKKVDKSKDGKSKATSQAPPLPGARFGPMPGVTKHRLFSRAALILGLMTVVYFSSGKKEEVFADTKTLKVKSMDTVCSPDISKNACQVKKCGRLVTDALVTGEEVYALIDLARRGFVSHPGLSVMDFGERTLKFEGLVKPLDGVFRPSDGAVFQAVKSKLQRMISAHFGVDYWKMNLAGPTFMAMIKPGGKDFSQMVSHDKILSYTYSTIVFLTDSEKDFKGGRLIFVDSDNTNRTVAPMQGRTVAFTSGVENSFFFERLEEGISYALFIGFTCDKGIKDPTF